MRRVALILSIVAGALLVPAGPASAHAGDTSKATNYRTTVTGITPAQPGLEVAVVEAGARLELVNRTGRTVEILGYQGEPYLEVRPDGTYENANSPSTYRNQTADGDSPVPATADPAAPPQWRRVSGATTVRWHDQRARWTGAGPPAAAQAEPGRVHRLRDWSLPLREQTRTFEIRGTLDYVPPPVAWLWWLGALLLAAAVTALGRRSVRAVGAVALVAGVVLLGYGVSRTLVTEVPLVLFVAALIAVAAGFWRAPFFTALAGAVLALFGGFSHLDVFTAAVVPSAGPAWFARVAVLVAIGAGAGLAATGVLRLREVSAPAAKVEP